MTLTVQNAWAHYSEPFLKNLYPNHEIPVTNPATWSRLFLLGVLRWLVYDFLIKNCCEPVNVFIHTHIDLAQGSAKKQKKVTYMMSPLLIVTGMCFSYSSSSEIFLILLFFLCNFKMSGKIYLMDQKRIKLHLLFFIMFIKSHIYFWPISPTCTSSFLHAAVSPII